MKWLLILAPFIVGLVAAILFIVIAGSFMARDHRATRSVRLTAEPGAVWALVSDFPSQPSWRPGLQSVDRAPEVNGHPAWRERGGPTDGMTMEVVESQPPGAGPGRLVTRIADDNLPFGGSWTYEVIPDASGTRVRITEDGFIKPGAFRYIARILGHASTIEKYLKALGAKLNTPVAIEP